MSFTDIVKRARSLSPQGDERAINSILSRIEDDYDLDFSTDELPTDLQTGRRSRIKKIGEAQIVIVGVGGGGCNTASALMRLGIEGATIIAINTDMAHLDRSLAHKKVLIGYSITGGLGAGGYPEVGRACAIKDSNKIAEALGSKPDLVFIAAGMGGGTGTGAAPVVARIAKEKGAIVISVVTMPFEHEGRDRRKKAVSGVRRLRKYSDTVIMISNDKLLQYKDLKLQEAFDLANYVLAVMVKGITEIINKKALINIDFADIKALMSVGGGLSAVGIGESSSEGGNRVIEAIEVALENKLLDYDVDGAKGALLLIIGGEDLTLDEATRGADMIHKKLAPDAVFKWGADIDPSMGKTVRVILVLAGIMSQSIIPGIEWSRERVAPRLAVDGGLLDPDGAAAEILERRKSLVYSILQMVFGQDGFMIFR